jgi:hypothetical protein
MPVDLDHRWLLAAARPCSPETQLCDDARGHGRAGAAADRRPANAELAGLACDKSASCAHNLELQQKNSGHLSEHAAPAGAAVSSYRCYFVDVANHIAAVHFVECATDDLAKARADDLLVNSVYPAMEVWDGARFVYVAKHQRGRLPAN